MALTLDQIRKENPAFANTTDEGLIKYLHKTSYSDMPFEELAKKVGYESPKDEAGNIRSYATIPFEKGVGNVGRAVGFGLEATGAAPATGRLLQESADELDTTLTGRQSKQAQLDAQHKIFNDKNEFQGLNAGSIVQSVAQSLPDMAVMGIVGQGMAKAIEGGLKVAGTVPEIAKWVGTSFGFGAAEGVDAGASNAAQTQQEIRKTPIDVLSKTQAFQETLANETDPKLGMEKRQELARDLVARKAGDFVFQDTAKTTGGISALMGGGGLGMLSRGTTGGLAAGTLKGMGLGGIEEAGQSNLEQKTQNQARKDFVNPEQDVNQGRLNASVEGLITGAIMGVGEGAGAGARGTEEVSSVVDEAIATSNAIVKAPPLQQPTAKQQPKTQYDEAFQAASQQHGVPEDFLKAVAMQESGIRQFDKNGNTVTPGTSNALGIMQMIPKWHPQYDIEKLAKDPVYNINAGAEFLGELLKKHNGDQAAALKDYFGSKDTAANDKYASEVLARITGEKSQVPTAPIEAASTFANIDGEVLKPQAQAQGPLSMTTNLDEILAQQPQPQQVKQEVTPPAVSEEVQAQPAAITAQPEDQFTPTHETADGTLVQHVIDNVFKDATGDEIVDDYAEPIKANVQPEAVQTRAPIATEEQQAPTNQRTVIQNETQPISSIDRTDSATNEATIRANQEQPTIPAAQEEINAANLRTQPEVQGVNQSPTVPVSSPIPAPIEGKRYGEVGGKLATGETVLTASGRETTPFPKFQNKNGITTAVHTKLVDSWLITNAAAEAKARGDDFNLLQFEGVNKAKPSQADKDSAEQYLFKQPETPTAKESLPVKNEIGQQPTVGAIAPDANAQTMASVNNPNAAKQQKPAAVRVAYHPSIISLANDLVEGGGVSYTYDEQGKVNGRTPSLNPGWFKDGSFILLSRKGEQLRSTPSVKEIKEAVSAYESGKTTTDKQNRILTALSNVAKEAEEEGYTPGEAIYSVRIQELLNKSKQVSDQYHKQIQRTIAKGDIITKANIHEWELEADDLIEAKTKSNSPASTDEVATEEPIATDYTEADIRKREDEQKQRDLAEQKTNREEVDGQDALVDEFMGAGQTGDVFGMTNPLQKVESRNPGFEKKLATLEGISESTIKGTMIDVEGVGEVSADKVLAHIKEKMDDIRSFIKCVRG